MRNNPSIKHVLSVIFLISFCIYGYADTYTYTGVGTWTTASNWTCSGTCPNGNTIPPNPLPSGSSIVINGNCLMNVNRRIDDGASLTVNPGAILTIGASRQLNNFGNIVNDGTIDNTGTFVVRNYFQNNGGFVNHPLSMVSGNGTWDGDFNNDGILDLDIGGIWTFTITGNYTASATAIHNIEIRNNAAGTNPESDRITVNGTASLDGTLNFTIDNANDIVSPNTFYPVMSGGLSGMFTTVNFPGVASDWMVTYTSANVLITYSGAPLPIELLSFQAKHVGNAIHLAWETATEEDNALMAVERSKDGRSFAEIGQRKGAGTTLEPQRYALVDEQPFSGINYYRLRQEDLDGKVNYHETISVLFKTDKVEEITLFPSLVSNQLNIALGEEIKNSGALRIVDSMGRVIKEAALGQGTQQETLDVSNLLGGRYYLSIQTGRQILMASFVKQ